MNSMISLCESKLLIVLGAPLTLSIHLEGRCVSLMVCTLVPEASGPVSSPGRGHCVVFLGKTLYSHGVSPPRCINGYRRI